MWVKVDDRMHTHRKSRAVYRSEPDKRRDVAPLGLWLAAASWAGQNQTDGWVPIEELDRWDDDWEALADRLVAAGYWLVADREGEPGYTFNDWHDYNDPAGSASKSGTFGNHVRWHAQQGRIDPECEHCPDIPDAPESGSDIAPESGGDRGAMSGRSDPTSESGRNPRDIRRSSAPPLAAANSAGRSSSQVRSGASGGESGGESRNPSGAIALPEPEPDPTRPDPSPEPLSSDDSPLVHTVDPPRDRFPEFWDTYGHKVGRKAAEQKWRLALKKPGVTADLLIAAAASYVEWERANNHGGEFIAHPATWLNGERWTDERTGRSVPRGRVQEHLALVQQLAQQEQALPEIGQRP